MGVLPSIIFLFLSRFAARLIFFLLFSSLYFWLTLILPNFHYCLRFLTFIFPFTFHSFSYVFRRGGRQKEARQEVEELKQSRIRLEEGRKAKHEAGEDEEQKRGRAQGGGKKAE